MVWCGHAWRVVSGGGYELLGGEETGKEGLKKCGSHMLLLLG